MKIKILIEKKLTDKDKKQKEKYVMGMKDNIDDFKDRYGDDAESVMYATATKMAQKNEEKLDELSAVGGIQGSAGVPFGKRSELEKFNKKQEEDSKLKGEELSEMFSSSAIKRVFRIKINSKKTHDGHVERSKHQGIKNVT